MIPPLHYAVIGAGIAGLAAARGLTRLGIDDVHVLELEDAAGGKQEVRGLGDFAETGTRELEAEDYVYALKRHASPRIEAPVFALFSEHVLGLKDMAGLLKPAAARVLFKALREVTSLPIHFHTHDTSGLNAASVLAACNADGTAATVGPALTFLGAPAAWPHP